MSKSPSPPARFRRVNVGLLPEAVQVGGIIYSTGPVNSPPGDGYLPADLLAARNVASAHLRLAKQLLTLLTGVKPSEFKKMLKDQREDHPDGTTSFRSSEAALLADELTCQNGTEFVSAIFDQLTAANQAGRSVTAGPVNEDNAHATAFAAAHQLANEVLRGEKLLISIADLDTLQMLVELEAWAAANRRAKGAAYEGVNSDPPFKVTPTMKKILTKCRRRHYKGATLANEVGLEYNYARKLFAKLVNAGLLRNDPELGYRTVKP